MLIWDTAPLALPSRGTAQFCLCQSQQPFPTRNIYNYFISSFYLIVFSGIHVVVATKRFWLYSPVLQTLGFKGMKGQLMVPFPLAGPREELTWAYSRP